jgi:hypothetical protein
LKILQMQNKCSTGWPTLPSHICACSWAFTHISQSSSLSESSTCPNFIANGWFYHSAISRWYPSDHESRCPTTPFPQITSKMFCWIDGPKG